MAGGGQRDGTVSCEGFGFHSLGAALLGKYLDHLSIARGSLKELETLLAVAERVGHLPVSELAKSAELCDHVSRMLTRMARSLRP